MNLDRTFLKVFADESASAPDTGEEVRDVFSLEEERQRRQGGLEETLEDETVFFSDQESFGSDFSIRVFNQGSESNDSGNVENSAGRKEWRDIDPAGPPEPTGRFRHLYAKRKKDEASQRNRPNDILAEVGNDLDRLTEIISIPTEASPISLRAFPETAAVSPPPDETALLSPNEEAILADPRLEPIPFPPKGVDSTKNSENSAEENPSSEFYPESRIGDKNNLWSELVGTATDITLTDWPRPFKRFMNRGREEFVRLSENILHRILAGHRIIGFGAANHEAGNSSILLGIARELAIGGVRVLTLDADFIHPSLACLVGAEPDFGWERLLRFPEPSKSGGLLRVTFRDDSPRKSWWERRAATCHSGDGRVPNATFYLLPLSESTVTDAATTGCKKAWLPTLLDIAESVDVVLVDHGTLKTDHDEGKVAEMLRFGDDAYYLTASAGENVASLEGFFARAERRRLPCLGIIENFI